MSNIDRMNFLCHKILPLVYDDSLSYYEFLCKVVQKINEVINSENELKNLTVGAHQLGVGEAPTVEKTGGDGTPIHFEFGFPSNQSSGGVESVNEKTGTVVLTAQDINANNGRSIQNNLERIDEEVEEKADEDIIAETWEAGEYEAGSVVKYNNKLYVARSNTEDMEDVPPDRNSDDWKEITVGDGFINIRTLAQLWKPDNEFYLNDIVYYNGKFYICVVNDTIDSPEDSDDWEIFNPIDEISHRTNIRNGEAEDSVIYGWSPRATGMRSIAGGAAANASADNSVALGNNVKATKTSAVALGIGSTVNVHAGFAAGRYCTTGSTTFGQCVVGKYNQITDEQFVVGCGESSQAKNCFSASADSNGSWIKIGNVQLTESELEQLKALIQ